MHWFSASAKIGTLHFLANLALLSCLKFRRFIWNENSLCVNCKENAKFEFWRIFYPRLWPYPWMKFDENLIRYRAWSLLRACRKSMHLADFSMSNHLRLCKKIFFFIIVFFQLNSMPWRVEKKKLPKSAKMPLIPLFLDSPCIYIVQILWWWGKGMAAEEKVKKLRLWGKKEGKKRQEIAPKMYPTASLSVRGKKLISKVAVKYIPLQKNLF